MTSIRIIGAGRAGLSFEGALRGAGHDVLGVWHHTDDLSEAALGVDVLLLAVPDRAIAATAAAVAPIPGTVVLHCSGSSTLEVLAPHERRGSLHPLVTLPEPVLGALRLRGGLFFAVAGDPAAEELALGLGGHPVVVPDSRRAGYHAAATIAANHLVALLGQVERVAATVGLPLQAFLPLAQGALDDVGFLGPAAALTGPASRGDLATLDRHRAVLDESERYGYEAGVSLAERLAGEREARAEEPESSAPGAPDTTTTATAVAAPPSAAVLT
jgi:predicted short-subunit dehydrogenase-like oxidoreductase (DUF2520 family)